ncbi:MAG: hypothetical protein OSB57_01850 [Planctomycetota bacterium]|nr:hypothetical protein [Planctomycetota bacterium]
MNIDETITTCPGCGLPAHATETNDNGYHPECSVLASTDEQYYAALKQDYADRVLFASGGFGNLGRSFECRWCFEEATKFAKEGSFDSAIESQIDAFREAGVRWRRRDGSLVSE